MSFPNIPDVEPSISLSREDVTNLLLASIAFEELGLSHLINAEAEKVQYMLGTLSGQERVPCLEVEDIFAVNKSVRSTISAISRKEMILLLKLGDIVENLLPQHLCAAPEPELDDREKKPNRHHKKDCKCMLCEMERAYKDLGKKSTDD